MRRQPRFIYSPKDLFHDDLPDVTPNVEAGRVVGRVNCDFWESSVFRCDGLESSGDLFYPSGSKIHLSFVTFQRSREAGLVRGILERLHPRREAPCGTEPDIGGKVFSGLRNP